MSYVDHRTEVKENILSTEPTHALMLWTADGSKEGGYWKNGYTYHGHVWGVIKPKVGRVIQNQHGDRYKVVRLGTEWMSWKNPPAQMKAAYAVPWSGK
jgi:hypothetical protein